MRSTRARPVVTLPRWLTSPSVAGLPVSTTIGQPLTAHGADIVEVSSRAAAPAAAMPHEDATGNDQQEEKDQEESNET